MLIIRNHKKRVNNLITPLSKKKLYEEIAAQIIAMIEKGMWLPGEKIPTEADLAAQFSVSRGTVREAVKSLQIAKILVSGAGRGTFVSADAAERISSRQLLDLMEDKAYLAELLEVRFIIEPRMAFMAAQHKDEDAVAALYESIAKMQRCTKREDMLSEGFLFHTTMAKLCGNRILEELYRSLSARLLKMRSLDFLTKEVYEKDVSEHMLIADAIHLGDGEAAANLMEKHLRTDYHAIS